ncbi:exocyst complex component 2 isoform 1-T2 [Lycaon pictus]|uniref:Exocyst complex component 2 n=3 Tax=Canis lupus TaxID=9612 RepID=A0A8C0REU8_CANLF|nr:exocyst complex component 2 isoform X1 [Canis lupus familiaris]XP_022270274.1 exocyst complex component 2 isoform X1 [Canis lupus familiaris]XP_025302108.3 exocyst complex component 2 isoform X1 [Canis lupus dingo]XP_038302133.1 exocyst complex component 2 isoform X1 [Canis lupus familiaris]XP_038302134.1 exocyst complex component 2 isoform X1 [Canis lupus familiaris]XP_038302135.1 exocyst complex component 2 isoform X1 [Canis lupus familiaris]XP_038302136.1 exocyst complex component 2 iso|eukprot:XP_005640029.1 exocyst complex component 2 isoform X1 [Canis lupus familiaris]
MSRSRQPPLVTGISPNEGIPWTKVTIRGENLGTGPTDLIGLTICGHNCLLTAEWMSASKIVCRVGQAKNDKGDIIVTTKSGGRGTSTVSFKLLKPEKIGLLDQSAVWVDEMNYYDMRTDRNKGIPPLSLRPANPLGIEIEKSKFPQKDLEMLFPGMSADFTSENFSAAWYLIENHSSTSFEQLKMAVTNLKRQANKKSEGSLAYVKGGLSTFFEAQDALSAIHQKLEADGTEKVEGSMTQKLENVLNRASNTADTLFQEVLGRKDKADSTRNALNVLQRFKFLFNLPLNIERNIQKGDYDVVINDYEKAKSLFGKTEVQVFKKYYAEVETRIEALRELLLAKLLETPSTLHDQKRYIRYLSDLHAPGDPAWQCIGAQHRWILQLMHSCKEGYVQDLKGTPGLHSPMLDLDTDARPVVLGHLSQTASLKRGSSFQSGRDDTWRYKTPHRVAFVVKLTKLVLSQLPNFWKLWISYVNGSLFSETAEKSGQIERSKNVRQRQNDFKKMIQEVMQCLVKLIRGALLPLSIPECGVRQYGGWEVKSELSGQWLAHVIQTIRHTYESLTALEIPNDMLQTIQDLILDLRVRCVMVTLQHTAEEIKRLAEKEDWIVDNEGLTSLPCQFEQCIVHSLQSLKGVLECKPGEASVFQQPRTQEDVCQLSINILQIFIYCLEQLSTKPDADVDTTHLSVDVSSPDLFGSIHEDFSLTSEQRLLIVLSNCCYLERHTFLNIAEHFEKHNFQGIEKITQVSMASLKELDQRLFENYIELKADPIVGSLEPGIYAGYFDWKDCLPPTGVRNYLKEALVNIIAVHAEVFTISKELVPRVLSRVVEAVSEELSRLMQCVSSFSKNGALQARLEICALRDTVAVHLTPESKSSFKQALEALPQLSSGADKKLLEELLNKFKSSMHLQLACFQAAASTVMKT